MLCFDQTVGLWKPRKVGPVCTKPANRRLILGSWLPHFLFSIHAPSCCATKFLISYIHTCTHIHTYIYIHTHISYIQIYQHPVLHLPPFRKTKNNIYLQGLTPKLPSCFDQQFSLPPSCFFWFAIAVQLYLRQQVQLPSNPRFPLAPPLLPLLQ